MDHEHLDQLFDQAARQLDAGEFEATLKTLDAFPQPILDAEDRMEWATMRALALGELGRIDEALDLLEPLLEEFPEAPRVLATYGVVLSNADDLGNAEQILEQAWELDPDDAFTIANLALTCERMHNYQRAVELYDRAIDQGVNIDWALVRKAAALRDAGKLDEAAATLKRYLSIMPDDVEQWIELAVLSDESGDTNTALSCFERASKLEFDNPDLHMDWGLTLARAGQLDAARVRLADLRRLEQRSIRSQLLEAVIHEEEGHIRRAEQCYEHALAAVNPEDEDDLVSALELAMDFYARRKNRKRCDELMRRAYAENACTVELCESYREIETRFASQAYWVSLVLEADYRRGLREAYLRGVDRSRPFRRYLRNFQVVAKDRDDAIAMVLEFVEKMGEKHARVREIVREERLQDAFIGLYEVDRDSVLVATEPERE